MSRLWFDGGMTTLQSFPNGLFPYGCLVVYGHYLNTQTHWWYASHAIVRRTHEIDVNVKLICELWSGFKYSIERRKKTKAIFFDIHTPIL